ncbi:hypothetical protein [Enterococcus sp. DIV1420a]|uniref:hypothetical protein n=1 Tax=Enterococcus sp. DIV1420a TaxID=2774672 RepID=UPI0012741194|nr:hypothetical protein [Listeria monocytogenes]
MFSFEEVILQLENKIALKTLKNWANKIEKVTDKRFERRYAKNSSGHTYSYKVFSVKDVEDFKELISLRESNVPLEESMTSVFMSEEGREYYFDKKSFLNMKRDIKELVELSQSILAENAELKERIVVLEKLLEN